MSYIQSLDFIQISFIFNWLKVTISELILQETFIFNECSFR